MENKIEIYTSADNRTEVKVVFDESTVWLTKNQMSMLFMRDRSVISRHVSNIFKEKELQKDEVCAFFAHTTEHGAILGKEQTRDVEYFNLDVIISVGYRVKSPQGVKFRQWATQRLKDYLVQGYAINEKRLEQKQQQIEYLKTGIRIISRTMEEAISEDTDNVFHLFARGLELLDDYDHEELDEAGSTIEETIFPDYKEYITMIDDMKAEFNSDFFARPKDDSFESSINQIKQSFGGIELYPSIESKAVNLLYFIIKNHSFVDGNKRIAATCFLYFLEKNNILFNTDGTTIIDNNTLASLTLFIAASKSQEADIVKRFAISILNRSKNNLNNN
jgi:prophage maintenance system killer protein